MRSWALRILGRFGGFGLVGLVRHSLNDPSVAVRPVAVDAVVQLARTGGAAEATAVLTLGRAAASADRTLAAAARAGLAELIKAPLEDEDEAAQRASFDAWWRGPTGTSAKIAALAGFALAKDPQPEGVLLGYLADPDPEVLLAAWQAMAAQARRLLTRPDLPVTRAGWLRSLPPLPAGATAASARAAKGRLDAWVAARPS